MYLELNGNGTLYEQLTRALKRSILQGHLKAGARLPATREIAAELGLSRNTVLTAYELLIAERLAVAKPGSGTYVTDAAWAQAPKREKVATGPQSDYARRMRQLSPIAIRRFESAVRYDLRYGEPLLDLPLISAWRRELARAALRSKLQYPPANGLRVLREAIVEYLARRRGVTCSAADIVIVNGTQQAINLIARLLINSGDTAVVEDPHYQFAVHALKAHGTKILSVATDRDGLTCEQLPQQAPRLVYVTPSNQFPSGAEMSVQRRLVLLAYAARQRRWIVEDDYDGEFRYDAHTTPALRSLDMNDRVIYVGTFSKVLFPALRLGYMVCPSGLRNDFVKAKQLEDLGSATIEQLAMASFMQSGAFDRHLRKATMELRRRRTTLLEGLQRHCGERIEIAGSNAGMHLVGWLPRWPADRVHALVDLAEQHGLGLHPIEPYYAHKPKRAGLLLGYASMSANQLRVATRIFGECLGKL